jgi:carbamoylphosphate synthase large subunit
VAALKPDGIVTFSEYQLALTAAIADACGLPFHSPSIVERLVDKFRQRQAFAAAGVQATGCVVVRSAAEAEAAATKVGLPAVVKPRTGAGDLMIVDNMLASHGRAAFTGARKLVVSMAGAVHWDSLTAA